MFDSLFFTIVIEAIVVLLLTRRPIFEVILLVIAIEFVTHPISMYAYNIWGTNLIFVEAVVVCVEWVMYVLIWNSKSLSEIRFMFIVSLIANIASFLILR